MRISDWSSDVCSSDLIGETMEALLADGFEKELVLDAAIAQSDSQRAAFWKLRELLSDSQRPEGGSIKCDISVPVSKMAEFIDQATAAIEAHVPGVRIVAFGHIGEVGRASCRGRVCHYGYISGVA